MAKLLWDLRADNWALVNGHGVRLAGAVDVQLHRVAWELEQAAEGAAGAGGGGRAGVALRGLGWVIEQTDHAGLEPAARRLAGHVRQTAQILFSEAPPGGPGGGGGGSGAVWRKRPLPGVLAAYCTDARVLFRLRERYAGAAAEHGAALLAGTERRLRESAAPDFPLQGAAGGLRVADGELVSTSRGRQRGPRA